MAQVWSGIAAAVDPGQAAITDDKQMQIILWLIGILVVISMVGILVHRFIMQSKAGPSVESNMTRPILAILLVGTVLILAAASLAFTDADTRNLLVGGVISLASGVVAFYFASSGATEARRDLLTATGNVGPVPDLRGKTLAEVRTLMSRSFARLEQPDPEPKSTDVVVSQVPAAGALVKSGAIVRVTFGLPKDVVGVPQTLSDRGGVPGQPSESRRAESDVVVDDLGQVPPPAVPAEGTSPSIEQGGASIPQLVGEIVAQLQALSTALSAASGTGEGPATEPSPVPPAEEPSAAGPATAEPQSDEPLTSP